MTIRRRTFEGQRRQWRPLVRSKGLKKFLGLSREQMDLFLNRNFEELTPFIRFSSDFEKSALAHVPLVSKVNTLLRVIGTAGTVRATKTGNLPPRIAQRLCELLFNHTGKVKAEGDFRWLVGLRYVVTQLGWLSSADNKFTLTQKGREIAQDGITPTDYITLLKFWLKDIEWGYVDRYPECHVMQRAALFSLLLLHKKAGTPCWSMELSEIFTEAQPLSLMFLDLPPNHPHTREATYAFFYQQRFLVSFGEEFGLVERVAKAERENAEYPELLWFKTTPLFSMILQWPCEEKKPTLIYLEGGGEWVH